MDVVIVAFNSGAYLKRSVEACLAASDVEIVWVCDNASSDQSLEALPKNDRICVLPMGGNLGFGAACNAGWQQSSADIIAFVNPDCEPTLDQLAQLRQHLDQPGAGIISAQLVNSDGSLQVPSLRRDPTPWRILAHFSGLNRLFPQLAINMAPANSSGVRSVDACSGALMLMRKSLLEQLEGFDEGYFLHCEDLDICRRARALGKRVLVDTRVEVLHAKGTSSAAVPKLVQRAKLLGMQRYFEKFDAAKLVFPIRLLFRAVIWLRIRAQNLRP